MGTKQPSSKYRGLTVKVVKTAQADGRLRTTLMVEELPAPPVSPASLHALTQGDHDPVELHCLVERTGGLATFESFGVPIAPPVPGGEYVLQPWWTLEQLDIVRDSRRTWTEVQFRPELAVKVESTDFVMLRKVRAADDSAAPGALVEGGWDHEHCTLCWTKISERPEAGLAYWSDDDWLCRECYERFFVSGLGALVGDACP